MSSGYTSVRITIEHRNKLRQIARYNRRSMVQQLAWLIEQAWEQQMEQAVSSPSAQEGGDTA